MAEASEQLRQIIKDKGYIYIKHISNRDGTIIQCPHCGYEYTMRSSHFLKGKAECPCKAKKPSQGEKFLFLLLRKLDIPFQFNRMLQPKGEGKKKYYDFIFHEHKLIIEIDGMHHYKQSQGWDDLSIIQARDAAKEVEANELGYTLVRVLYDSFHWPKFFSDIDNILSEHLGYPDVTISLKDFTLLLD